MSLIRDTIIQGSKSQAGIVLEENQDVKEALRILNYMNSPKYTWWERIISFLLGILASVLASLILRACKFV